MARLDSRPTRKRSPFLTDGLADDAFLAHVERVFAGGPPAATAVVSPPIPPAPSPAPAAERPGPPLTLRCRCGWAVECLPADRARFVRKGCLLCGGGLAVRPAAAAPAGPPDARRRKRRQPRGGARVEVRRAEGAAGPDLALALADVCAEGVGVWLTAAVRPGELVVVTLTASRNRGAVAMAEVRWCAPAKDWTYRAGLRLGRPLAAEAVAEVSL